jgi:Ca-activated chloride channel family protein
MRFLWSDLLWALLLVPALGAAYVGVLRRRKRSALRYASLGLVRDALGPGQWMRRHLPAALVGLALVCALLGIARPIAVFALPNQYQTIVLAMDVSRSMRAVDIEPSRIVAAQTAVKDFIKELPANVRVGIVTFAGTAALAQSPTENRDDLLAAVDRFQLQSQTAIGSGLALALNTLLPESPIEIDENFFFGGAPPKSRPAPVETFRPVAPGSYRAGAVVLLSDGRRTTGPDPLRIARLAAERGVKVHTIGFGSAAGGMASFDGMSMFMRFDETTLRAIAGITDGQYTHAGNAADLHKVYASLTARLVLERQETELTGLFAGAAALLTAIAAVLSLLWFHRAPA